MEANQMLLVRALRVQFALAETADERQDTFYYAVRTARQLARIYARFDIKGFLQEVMS
jgi:hypothetical protein